MEVPRETRAWPVLLSGTCAPGTVYSGTHAHIWGMEGEAGQVPPQHRPLTPAGLTTRGRHPGQLYGRERRPSPGFRHGRTPGHRRRLSAGESWTGYREVAGQPEQWGPRSGLHTPLTWMIRSPSRIRPSLAAMLLGFTCKADASWGPGTPHSGSLLVTGGNLALGVPEAS